MLLPKGPIARARRARPAHRRHSSDDVATSEVWKAWACGISAPTRPTLRGPSSSPSRAAARERVTFQCDVNLLTDRDNCGECGNRCENPSLPAKYECSEGHCLLACDPTSGRLDCDGIPDNGCETDITTNEHCGSCGVKCTDPKKPCIRSGSDHRCGCPDGKIYCQDASGDGRCVDPRTDDQNCGGCNVACDGGGDGGDLPSNTYLGCVESQCGRVKCQSDFRDCDTDLNAPSSNGCEANIWSRDNCGSCGNACPAEQECQGNEYMMPTCSCPKGMIYCPAFCMDMGGRTQCLVGMCVDIESDAEHCGGCFNSCKSSSNTSISTCSFGVCSTQCHKGRADCNGNDSDGCEVNVDQDPNNCGACGKVCDAVAGQACVGGRCVVEPCDAIESDGGFAR